MILNNLGAILAKQKQVKPHYSIFIKQFQEQLQFIESIIEDDAQQMKSQSKCCYSCLKHIFPYRKNNNNRFYKFNPIFWSVFSQMTPADRQQYYLEILKYIQKLLAIYNHYQKEREAIERKNVNNYKSKVESKLIDEVINKQNMKLLEEEQNLQHSYEIGVRIHAKIHKKIVRLNNWKLELIEKRRGQQEIIVIDLRNYIIARYSLEKKQLLLKTIYQTIKPISAQLYFSHDDAVYSKYFSIFSQMIKVGKIEKLIHSIDLVQIFGKDYYRRQGINESLMKTFVNNVSDHSQSDDDLPNSQEFLKSAKVKQLRLRKMQTLKAERYEEAKRKLIQTLNFLAAKRQKQNDKIQQFLRKDAISKPKPKSSSILRVLSSTEAFIPKKIQYNNMIKDPIYQQVLSYALQIQKHPQQKSWLRIMTKKQKKGSQEPKAMQKIDSFQNESDRLSSQDFDKIFNKNIISRPLIFKKNVYKTLYKNYNFFQALSWIDMISDDFALKNSLVQKIVHLDRHKSYAKQNSFQKVIAKIRLYCRKKNPNFFKIVIPFTIQIKSLVDALVNVHKYPLWHPQVKSASIKEVIKDQNYLIYQSQIVNSQTGKAYHQQKLLHLFRFQGKYYIIQKTINTPNKQKKGLLSWIGLAKDPILHHKIKFVLIEISNINKNGASQVTISVDYDYVDTKNAELARKEVVTYFLNYLLITNYWKAQQSDRDIIDILSVDWIVSKSSFSLDEPSSYIETKPLKIELQNNMKQNRKEGEQNKKQILGSSSELIHDDVSNF